MRKPPLFAGLIALMGLSAVKLTKGDDTAPFIRPEDLILQPGSFMGRGGGGSYFAGHIAPGKLQKSRSRMYKRSRINSRCNAKH